MASALPEFPLEQLPYLRAGALDGICPICGQGPWPSLGLHCSKKHEVGARDLKAALGIPARRSLSSPQLRRQARERALTMPQRTAQLIEGGRGAARNTGMGQAGTRARLWGLHTARTRSARARRKISDSQVAAASTRIAAGERYADVGHDLGVTASGLWYRVKQWRATQQRPEQKP